MAQVNIFSALGLGERAGGFVPAAGAHVPGTRVSVALPSAGSRRKRLWELEAGAHCPVVGVCLAMADLRRLAGRHWPQESYACDYALHGAVVAAGRSRSPLSEALQKELESRYRPAVHRASEARDAQALAAWWRAQAQGPELAGALWATLTHPRCDAALSQQVIGEVHMLQHQIGTRERVEVRRLDAALAEKAALAQQLADAQGRLQGQSAQAARRMQALEGELLRLRAELIGRDTLLAQREEELQALQHASAALRTQAQLQREGERLARRAEDLQAELERTRGELARVRERAEARVPEPAAREPERAAPAAAPACRLGDCAVLCVGGRPASVPMYRHTVQRAGARFLHHDGDDGDKAARLEETLRAADLVICQTGCISHGAYWRVKDHCKRTGTPCLFVETPSRSALERALAEAAARLAAPGEPA